MPTRPRQHSKAAALVTAVLLAAILSAGLGAGMVSLLIAMVGGEDSGCSASTGAGSAAAVVLGPPGSGRLVGATEYGGPGDPRSSSTGARGDSLVQHPDTYAELGGITWQTATSMGGLQYLAPLRITWSSHAAIAYKRDFGLGGGPVAGLPRVIDLWWQFAGRLGIPYDNGLWSGPVRIERPPDAGAGNVLGQSALQAASLVPSATDPQNPSACAPGNLGGVSLTPGQRARMLPSGLAAAPQSARSRSRR